MQIDIVLLFNFLEYASRGFRRERMQVAAIMVVLSYGSMCQNFVVPGAHGYECGRLKANTACVLLFDIHFVKTLAITWDYNAPRFMHVR